MKLLGLFLGLRYTRITSATPGLPDTDFSKPENSMYVAAVAAFI